MADTGTARTRRAWASSRSAARRRSSTPSRSSRSCAPRATHRADYDGADLVVVNTCGFIDAAVAESLDAIGEALAENGKVIVTGCLGARKAARSCATRIRRCSRSPAARDARSDERGARAPAEAARPVRDLVPPQGIKLTPQHYAYLKISEGCNHRCTFCIIPVDARRPRAAGRSAT
jgi:tRNA A37 methylthiotransferase MiaB